jgi:hypothetical protein
MVLQQKNSNDHETDDREIESTPSQQKVFFKNCDVLQKKKTILLKILLPTPHGEQKEIPQMG